MHRTIGGLAAQPVRRTNHLPCFESTAREQRTAHARPVITTTLRVDDRRATKLTPRDDCDILVEPALMQILDERGHALIKQRQMAQQLRVIVIVEVPAAKIQRHHARSGLDETTREKEVLQIQRRAVAVVLRIALAVALAHLRRLLAQIERAEQLAAREHVQRLLVEGIHAAH